LHVIADRAGSALRHRVADFDKEAGEIVFFPVREECGAFDGGPSLGPDKRYVVAPRARSIKCAFASHSLRGREDAIPDFLRSGLLRGERNRKREDHAHETHKNPKRFQTALLFTWRVRPAADSRSLPSNLEAAPQHWHSHDRRRPGLQRRRRDRRHLRLARYPKQCGPVYLSYPTGRLGLRHIG